MRGKAGKGVGPPPLSRMTGPGRNGRCRAESGEEKLADRLAGHPVNVAARNAEIGQFAVRQAIEFGKRLVVAPPAVVTFDECREHDVIPLGMFGFQIAMYGQQFRCNAIN